MWNLKNDTNGFIYKAETHSQTQHPNVWLPKGKVGVGDGRRGKLGVLDEQIHITIYKQQGPIV